mmetsp:Transcript_6966/g.20896  ORF Transcript_6966/g.20896 Transcript_6966/m.20896 type:complete len:532 (-) Transcript_6966:335-1930(-)
MATSLISDDCRTVADANALFATEKGLLVLRPGRSGCGGCCNLHFTVPSGCYALVTRHGADLNYEGPDGKSTPVWPAGLHYPHPPWVGVSNLITMQSIVLDLPVKACKTKDNVTVNVDVALVFRIMGDAARGEDPELVRKFVYEVKPRGLEQQLKDAQEEAVRALARSMRHTQIYGIRSGADEYEAASKKGKDGSNSSEGGDRTKGEGGGGDTDSDLDSVASDSDEIFVGSSDAADRKTAKRGTRQGVRVAAEMRDRLNRQFIPQGVEIQSVMIKQISLPPDITDQMNEKTMVISQNAQQRMYHEDAMQETRMDMEVMKMTQSFSEERERETASGQERINEDMVKLSDEKAQAKKAEANIHEETKVKIDSMLAENSLEVQRVEDRTYESISEMRAQSEKESAELLAHSRASAQSSLADADLTATKNRAEASRTLAAAEGKVAPWLERRKEHETEQKKLGVYKRLADNGGLVVGMGGGVEDDDEDANLLTVADAILQDSVAAGNGEAGDRSRLMAELALVAKGSSAFLPQAAS